MIASTWPGASGGRRQCWYSTSAGVQIGPARRYGVVAGSPGAVTEISWWYSLVTGSATLIPASSDGVGQRTVV